jgi:hypothetical protein
MNNNKTKYTYNVEKLKQERLIELATLFPFNFTKDMELFKEVPRKSPEYVKNKIKNIFKTMGLDANDLPIQGTQTTKIINALDLPRNYHKRLMIEAKKEYFAEIAEALQNRPHETIPSPQVSAFSCLQQPRNDGFYATWLDEIIAKDPPVSQKQVDDFFETLEASISVPPPAAAIKRKTRPTNVAEPPSKKKKIAVSSPPQVSSQDITAQNQDAESWFNSISDLPPKSDCACSIGSLGEILNIQTLSYEAVGNISINYDTLFD